MQSVSLPLEDYRRYGRQMVLDGFGLPGQLKLLNAAVAVVGAGGLGCPALQYLGAAGVGRIGIIDGDRVELSNLQRQILHNEESLGMYKSESAKNALIRMNASLVVDAITTTICAENAISLLQDYDVILDCTDNVPTRYLLSDAVVALGKPLVSGAAQKYDGQLCVYNLGSEGPCYRCVFPTPPSPQNAGSCEELGIIGPITGVIGNMQALEVIKLLTGLHDRRPCMLVYSALANPPFRTIKLRSRRPHCTACGAGVDAGILINSTDYVQFCGGGPPDWEERGLQQGDIAHRITPQEFAAVLRSQNPINLLDVRPVTEFSICNLPNSRNVPLKKVLENPKEYMPHSTKTNTFLVCRLGNDSQIAASALRRVPDAGKVQDLIGGLKAWSQQIEHTFPQY